MEEIKVTPLGTVSPFCFKNLNCSGYLIKYNNQKYLLDAGNGISRNIDFPSDLNNLKILISHLHPDHYEELTVLCQSALIYKRLNMLKNDLVVYIPARDYINDKHTIEYDFIHSLEKKYPVKVINYNTLNIKNDNLRITSTLVPHQIKANAFKLETDNLSLVYSGDTGSENNLREFAKNANLLICESTYLEGQVKNGDNHLYASEAGSIAKDAHVGKLLLTHFWPHLSKKLYVNEAKNYFNNTEYAVEGKSLILKK